MKEKIALAFLVATTLFVGSFLYGVSKPPYKDPKTLSKKDFQRYTKIKKEIAEIEKTKKEWLDLLGHTKGLPQSYYIREAELKKEKKAVLHNADYLTWQHRLNARLQGVFND